MDVLHISKPDRHLKGEVQLAGSKSISNRALIIQALCTGPFEIKRLANAKDTITLQALLTSEEELLDVGAAGTTFRFLTAFLASRPGTQILTGSERMKQRPIGVLVEALRSLGAQIAYVEAEGYPPLRIGHQAGFGEDAQLRIPASTSSQYITALLLLGPTLPQGIRLELEGKIVSRPYIEMTLGLMRHFGVQHTWEGNVIRVAPQAYQANDFTVEADWSAASYYYSLAALSDSCELQLHGLFADSFQGDAVLQEMYKAFGVATEFNETGLRLTKAAGTAAPPLFEYDFISCPDIAQTLAVTCAGLGTQGLFTGLETLRIKETDRIAALKNELSKVNSFFSPLPARFSKNSQKEYFMLEGKAAWTEAPTFATYEDHRMAMAFAPLAMYAPVAIAEPDVVAKSYPDFWKDLESLGFEGDPAFF
ncbi:3-phosphoshikimate 1-carboxyvinyltransferase [Lewinella sp. LCG006]|uniref:3-phosphoshikimate 1-carboxyvinyltransferase n=1 Tax=Lewinella sp. LCG006 TaxID=3231911 RepID=UPI00345F54C3